MIVQSNNWLTQQGVLRDAGMTDNAITNFLKGTPSEGMRTDDFMFYYADIQVEAVQYGHRQELCAMLYELQTASATQQTIFNSMTSFGNTVAGVNPPDYNTYVTASTVIDTKSSARPWTY